MKTSNRTTGLPILVTTLLAAAAFWPLGGLQAADAEFVGTLALAKQFAAELQLTEDQTAQLDTVIETREREAVDLVLQLLDASDAEREAQMEPFRLESERQGLSILTAEQQALLEKIRLQRAGGAATSPAETAVAEPADAESADAEPTADTEPTDTEPAVVEPTDTEPADTSLTETGPVTSGPGTLEPGLPLPVESDYVPSDSDGPATPGETAEQPADTGMVAPGETELPADDETLEAEAAPQGPVMLRFAFHHQPWKDVIDWFIEQAGLSLVTDTYPTGTFNYSDDREYTATEALDVINSVLLTKNYTLVRRRQAVMLINLEDGIPPNLVPTIAPEELDDRGEYELVTVLFDLNRFDADEAKSEIEDLLGPQGSVVALPQSKQLLVTETAGHLRGIRRMIERVEDPKGLRSSQMKVFEIKHAMPEDVMDVVRQLLAIPTEENATPDGSLRLVLDVMRSRILASGSADMLARLDEIVQTLDIPLPGAENASGALESPQLEVYSITAADPQSALEVMQTLMAGQPDVRLAIDSKTGNLIALARPAQHATIRATLEQMQRDAQIIEVIPLRTVDPQVAVLSINKLFGSGGEETKASAPQIDADPITGQLLIRGTKLQIDQIRELLVKMGESESDSPDALRGGNVRMLPLTGSEAQSALEQAQEIWPVMRPNRIRVVTPSSEIPSIRPSSPGASQGIKPLPGPGIPSPIEEEPLRAVPRPTSTPLPPEDNSARLPMGARVIFASQQSEEPPATLPNGQPEGNLPVPGPAIEGRREVPPENSEGNSSVETKKPAGEPPQIVVVPGPDGIMIASDDLEALNEFEDLMNKLASSGAFNKPEITIFYLKNAKASTVAQTLDQIFGGGTLSASEGSSGGGGGAGGGVIGDLAGAALGDAGGNMLGALLGLGGSSGTIAPTGEIRITPDPRLNALVVQANPTDVETIEQLLKILDQKESPEDVLVQPKAKVIPVINTQAQEIADILKTVYQDRMNAARQEGGNNGGRPSPEEFMRMFRGSRGGSRGGSSNVEEEIQKMSLSVDTRTNSLIVVAPEALLEEVEQLVGQLDRAAVEANNQAIRVVTLHQASPEAVQQAIEAIIGEGAQVGRTTPSRPSGSSTSQPSTPSPTPSPPSTTPQPPSSGFRPPSFGYGSSRGGSFRRPGGR